MTGGWGGGVKNRQPNLSTGGGGLCVLSHNLVTADRQGVIPQRLRVTYWNIKVIERGAGPLVGFSEVWNTLQDSGGSRVLPLNLLKTTYKENGEF